VHRAPDGAFCAGRLRTTASWMEARKAWSCWSAFCWSRSRCAPAAIEGGAKADQEFAVNPAQAVSAWAYNLDAPSVRKRQG